VSCGRQGRTNVIGFSWFLSGLPLPLIEPTDQIVQRRHSLAGTRFNLSDDGQKGRSNPASHPTLPAAFCRCTPRNRQKKEGRREASADQRDDCHVRTAGFKWRVLSRPINERWGYGFGARLVAPTAEDSLGTGRWQIMPGFGVRYSFLEFGDDTYFVPKLRYAVSFGGDPSRRNRNEPQIAPTLNIGLPDRWFMTLYPSYDIRINYGDPVPGQTGRLFLPFDAAIGRKITDKATIIWEIAVPIVKDYPVYNFKTELRLTIDF
jgi:hypothetical protein